MSELRRLYVTKTSRKLATIRRDVRQKPHEGREEWLNRTAYMVFLWLQFQNLYDCMVKGKHDKK